MVVEKTLGKNLQYKTIAGMTLEYLQRLAKEYKPLPQPAPEVRIEKEGLPPEQLQVIVEGLKSKDEEVAAGSFVSALTLILKNALTREDAIEILKAALQADYEYIQLKALELISAQLLEDQVELMKTAVEFGTDKTKLKVLEMPIPENKKEEFFKIVLDNGEESSVLKTIGYLFKLKPAPESELWERASKRFGEILRNFHVNNEMCELSNLIPQFPEGYRVELIMNALISRTEKIKQNASELISTAPKKCWPALIKRALKTHDFEIQQKGLEYISILQKEKSDDIKAQLPSVIEAGLDSKYLLIITKAAEHLLKLEPNQQAGLWKKASERVAVVLVQNPSYEDNYVGCCDLIPYFPEEYRPKLVRAALKSENKTVQATGLKLFKTLPKEEHYGCIMQALENSDDKIKLKMLKLIPKQPAEKQPELIMKAFECSNENKLKMEALGLVTAQAPEERQKLIIKALHFSYNTELRPKLLELIFSQPEEYQPELMKIALADETVGVELLKFTRTQHPQRQLKILEQALKSKNSTWTMKLEALKWAAELISQGTENQQEIVGKAFEVFKQLFKSEGYYEHFDQIAALDLIGVCSPKQQMELLEMALLKSRYGDLQQKAAELLPKIIEKM